MILSRVLQPLYHSTHWPSGGIAYFVLGLSHPVRGRPPSLWAFSYSPRRQVDCSCRRRSFRLSLWSFRPQEPLLSASEGRQPSIIRKEEAQDTTSSKAALHYHRQTAGCLPGRAGAATTVFSHEFQALCLPSDGPIAFPVLSDVSKWPVLLRLVILLLPPDPAVTLFLAESVPQTEAPAYRRRGVVPSRRLTIWPKRALFDN